MGLEKLKKREPEMTAKAGCQFMFHKSSIDKLIKEINLDTKNETSTTIGFRSECF